VLLYQFSNTAKFIRRSTADIGVLPGKSDVKAVLERETLLHGRSWKNINDCVRNLLTMRHHSTTLSCPNLKKTIYSDFVDFVMIFLQP